MSTGRELISSDEVTRFSNSAEYAGGIHLIAYHPTSRISDFLQLLPHYHMYIYMLTP